LVASNPSTSSVPDALLQGFVEEKLKEGIGKVKALVDPVKLPTLAHTIDAKVGKVSFSVSLFSNMNYL